MELSNLVKAHSHAQKASLATENHNLTLAADEHESASRLFNDARSDTQDTEALRILQILADQHTRLAKSLRLQISSSLNTPSCELKPSIDSDSEADFNRIFKSPGGSLYTSSFLPHHPQNTTKHTLGPNNSIFPVKPAKTAFPSVALNKSHTMLKHPIFESHSSTHSISSTHSPTFSHPHPQFHSLSSSSESSDRKCRSRKTFPNTSRHSNSHRIPFQNLNLPVSNPVHPVASCLSPRPTSLPMSLDSPVLSSSASLKSPSYSKHREKSRTPSDHSFSAPFSDPGDSFDQFYSTFEFLFSKLSAPLAFAGLPLTPHNIPDHLHRSSHSRKTSLPTSSSSTQTSNTSRHRALAYSYQAYENPNLTSIYSRAALRAISEDHSDISESYYLVKSPSNVDQSSSVSSNDLPDS